MAKWTEPSDETYQLIKSVLNDAGLENQINTKIIVNDDQTKIITIKKESEASKFAYGYDLIMVVNEQIFDELPPKLQLQAIEETLGDTHFNPETNKLVIPTPSKVHRGFIDRYGWDEYEVLVESIKTLYESKKNKETVEGDV